MRTLIDKRTAGQIAGGYHPEHLLRLAKEGRFPKPIKLGVGPHGRVRFDKDEVIRWVEERCAARDQLASA